MCKVSRKYLAFIWCMFYRILVFKSLIHCLFGTILSNTISVSLGDKEKHSLLNPLITSGFYIWAKVAINGNFLTDLIVSGRLE